MVHALALVKYNQPNSILFLPLTIIEFCSTGVRLGVITTKIALISLLHKYDFACINDQELKLAAHSPTLVVEGGINVRITNRVEK